AVEQELLPRHRRTAVPAHARTPQLSLVPDSPPRAGEGVPPLDVSPPADSGRTPVEAALASLSSDALLRFLGRQRWFGDKGAADAKASVAGYVVVPWGIGSFAIARIAVEAQ